MNRDKNDIFADLYKQHASYMYGVCLRYTKDADDAKDVMQDGFVKIFQSLDTFRGEANIKTWMRTIMVNTAINFYRHKHILQLESVDQAYTAHMPQTDETVISKMTTDELLSIINLLPDGYRLVFNMYVIEGYKHKEIAEMLGITEGTSKSQLSKAKSYLQVLAEEKLNINVENVKY